MTFIRPCSPPKAWFPPSFFNYWAPLERSTCISGISSVSSLTSNSSLRCAIGIVGTSSLTHPASSLTSHSNGVFSSVVSLTFWKHFHSTASNIFETTFLAANIPSFCSPSIVCLISQPFPLEMPLPHPLSPTRNPGRHSSEALFSVILNSLSLSPSGQALATMLGRVIPNTRSNADLYFLSLASCAGWNKQNLTLYLLQVCLLAVGRERH